MGGVSAHESPLTFDPEVLRHEPGYVYAAVSRLRVVAVLQVKRRHAVQPSLPQLRGGAVGLGQSVVKVNQLLLVNLMNLINSKQD